MASLTSRRSPDRTGGLALTARAPVDPSASSLYRTRSSGTATTRVSRSGWSSAVTAVRHHPRTCRETALSAGNEAPVPTGDPVGDQAAVLLRRLLPRARALFERLVGLTNDV